MGNRPTPVRVQIRAFADEDADALGQIMFQAVRQGSAAFYDAAQRGAWMPEPRSGKPWLERLQRQQTWVAQDAQGHAGFMTLAPDGFIDLAYVRPDLMGAGVAQALYLVLEQAALSQGIPRLYTEASHLAQRFFARRGWHLVRTQSVVANGVTMQNHQMEKLLSEAEHEQTGD